MAGQDRATTGVWWTRDGTNVLKKVDTRPVNVTGWLNVNAFWSSKKLNGILFEHE